MCVPPFLFIILASIFFKTFWILRFGCLVHWSFLIGNYLYPNDTKNSILVTASLSTFVLLGSFIPKFLFPRLKSIATAFSIPPQLHMLVILNKMHKNVSDKIENATLSKTIHAYAGLTLICTVWTVVSLLS